MWGPATFLILAFTLACSGEPPPAEAPDPAEDTGAERPADPSRPQGGDTDSGIHADVDPEVRRAAEQTWARARQRGVDFRATGNEPGWYLEVDQDGPMVVVLDYGEVTDTVPTPEKLGADDGYMYVAETRHGRLLVRVKEERCGDSMSGYPYPLSVRVELGDRTYDGCGRDR